MEQKAGDPRDSRPEIIKGIHNEYNAYMKIRSITLNKQVKLG